MDQLIDTLSALSLLEWIIVVVIWLITNAIIYLSFAKWLFRRQWTFYKNLKRQIIILTPMLADGSTMTGAEMKNEIQLLRDNGFLNVKAEPGDYRSFNPTGKHCIVVIGYKSSMDGLNDILDRIKSNHVPLIVYTYGNNAVAGSDKSLLDQYPYTLYANFPLTLLNHIFSTVASYPYESK